VGEPAARRLTGAVTGGYARAVPRSWNSDPVVLTVAVTGADVSRENNPNIPYTPAEIADSSIEAAGAGATVVHLHVREDDGTPSGRPELFQEVITRIRNGSSLVTMVSTGGSNEMTIEERTPGLEAGPDLSGVESGSMNFGDDTFITPPRAARGIIERATEKGIGLEVEAFDVGHVMSAVRWLEQDVIPSPMRINLVFGVPGGIDASPEALSAMLRPLPPETFWTVTCVGRHHPRMLALALLHGAPGIRTGLEDAVYIRRGVLAPSNAALVTAAIDLARAVGREVADQEQTRSLLGLAAA
jgi:3-keto-5-aminohexanoate cleavage enzyme